MDDWSHGHSPSTNITELFRVSKRIANTFERLIKAVSLVCDMPLHR